MYRQFIDSVAFVNYKCCTCLRPSYLYCTDTTRYLAKSYSTVRLEKLPGSQLYKKFPTFYGTRMFITTFTSARHLSLS